jgi:hypothetical protein
MSRNFIMAIITLVTVILAVGCSGNGTNPVTLVTDNQIISQVVNPTQDVHNSLLGYYDIYFDPQDGSFEAVENRSAEFTLNVVPFLNKMTSPTNGITFSSILIHSDDPSFIGVDVEFQIYHPFPGIDQYNAYDLRGVVIGNGHSVMEYENLTSATHGTDLWMKNPDGYTRWFNPTEFTTQLIFGYAPGGYQNLAGDALLNPYKYYSAQMDPDENAWDYLTGPNNHDGLFQSGGGRMMELEFPLPPDGVGIMFGYAAIVAWEEQGPTGPYTPVHVPEALACNATQTPDVWYNSTDGSGGDLILDIDLFAWDEQPSIVKIESSVLDGIKEFDFDTYAGTGGENYSTWHVEAAAKPLTSAENHYYWVIAEYDGYDYSNGFDSIPHADGPLAAFFRYGVEVLPGTSGNEPPVCDLQVVTALPANGWDVGVPVEFDASGSTDPDGDDLLLQYEWDFDGDSVFGDTFEGTAVNPTHIYTNNYDGQVAVKVTDPDGGESICYADIQVITHQSKNIPVDDLPFARDIAIDHTNGDIAIIYSDGVPGTGSPSDQIWRVSRSDWFQNASPIVTDIYWGSPDAFAIDMAPNQYMILATNHIAGVQNEQAYGPDGSWLWCVQQGGSDLVDVAGFCAGDFLNSLAYSKGWTSPFPEEYDLIRHPYIPDDPVNGPYYWVPNWEQYLPDSWYGIDQIHSSFVVAMETDGVGNYVWYLEDDPEYYASRWEVIHPNESVAWGQLVYSGAYFGTGAQSDADDTWNHSKDMTRDDQDRFFVLDELSDGTPRVKMWSVDGATTTPMGGFGNSTSIMGDPLRIEGSDWSGEVVVLHVDDTDPLNPVYMISVFLPSEMPG